MNLHMKKSLFHVKGKNQVSALLVILFLLSIATVNVGKASPALSITVSTDKQFYYLREKVTIYGNLMSDSKPVPDGLVALQIDNPKGPFLFRTLSTGTTPTGGLVKIIDVIPVDENLRPKSKFKPGSWLYLNVTGRNDDIYSHYVTLTVSVYDGNQNTIGLAMPSSFSVGANSIFNRYPKVLIPAWASIGNATAYANVYTDFPKDRGSPYSREVSATFEILSVEISSLAVQSRYNSAESETLQTSGSYSTTFRILPDPEIGKHMVYVSTSYPALFAESAYKFTSFEVKSTSYPPTASFIYIPPKAYVNMTVTFDASASTPNGGTITNYIWNFGDGTPLFNTTSTTTTHKYTQSDTYTVTLNVTDSEGLWGAQMLPIKIWPPEGPFARFSWTPPKPSVNEAVTFDASSSSPGWNGTGWAPIVSYKWNFGDGNITTIFKPTIIHVYKAEENYTVTLNVTDTQGLSSSTSKIVEVKTAPTLGPWDVNGDGTVDIFDLVIVGAAFGSMPGDPNWNIAADIDKSGIVDIFDLVLVGSHFGETA